MAGIPEPLVKRVFFRLNANLYQLKKYFVNSSSQTFYLTDSITYTRTLTNGNMQGGSDSTWSSSYYPLPQHLDLLILLTIKKSILLFKFLGLGYYDNLFSAEFYFSGKNNLIGYSSIESPPSSGSGITNIAIQYNYRSDGYPLTGFMSGNQDFNKMTFTYIKL